ncbi:MAG: hypothetical protein Q7K29_04225 [Thermoleophilia bacterium]|nr:hypothetical protein [Thermoleophilia bacterium]
MKCSKCGKENADGNWVCGGCGESLAPSPQPYQPYENDYSENELLPKSSQAPEKSGSSSAIVKIVACLLVAILAAILTWNFFLKGTDTNTPSGTMEAYINAVSNDDCEAMYDLIPADQIPANRSQATSTCSQMMGLLNIDFTDYKTLGETIDGDTATVDFQVTIEAAGQSVPLESSMSLIREGGKWKVEPESQ